MVADDILRQDAATFAAYCVGTAFPALVGCICLAVIHGWLPMATKAHNAVIRGTQRMMLFVVSDAAFFAAGVYLVQLFRMDRFSSFGFEGGHQDEWRLIFMPWIVALGVMGVGVPFWMSNWFAHPSLISSFFLSTPALAWAALGLMLSVAPNYSWTFGGLAIAQTAALVVFAIRIYMLTHIQLTLIWFISLKPFAREPKIPVPSPTLLAVAASLGSMITAQVTGMLTSAFWHPWGQIAPLYIYVVIFTVPLIVLAFVTIIGIESRLPLDGFFGTMYGNYNSTREILAYLNEIGFIAGVKHALIHTGTALPVCDQFGVATGKKVTPESFQRAVAAGLSGASFAGMHPDVPRGPFGHPVNHPQTRPGLVDAAIAMRRERDVASALAKKPTTPEPNCADTIPHLRGADKLTEDHISLLRGNRGTS